MIRFNGKTRVIYLSGAGIVVTAVNIIYLWRVL